MPPTPTSALRILLVEDNELNRLLLRDYLEYCGYEVMALPEGTHFFDYLSDFQPHLVLLDLKLPQVDGYTILREMQKQRAWQSIPVFVISAFAFQSEKQRAIALGARRYLVKPVSLSELKQVIHDELYHQP